MTFLEAIAAGGDIGILAVAFGLWKLDRRLLKIELWAEHQTIDAD